MKVKVIWWEKREKIMDISEDAEFELNTYHETLLIVKECDLFSKKFSHVETLSGKEIAGNSLKSYMR